MRNGKTRRNVVGIACAAALLGSLAGCGSDIASVSYDCCLNSVWYVCASAQAYGRCLPANYVPDPTGCAQVAGACPPNANK